MNLPTVWLAVQEGLTSIKANKVKSILTAALVTIGITSLVGVLTAVDSIQASVSSNFAKLGAASIDLYEKGHQGRGRRFGLQDKLAPDLNYTQCKLFAEKIGSGLIVTIHKVISNSTSVKSQRAKSSPNVHTVASDQAYLASFGHNLAQGRNFTSLEISEGKPVAIIGGELAEEVLPGLPPLNQQVVALGKVFKVVGVLKSAGGVMSGPNANRLFLIPEAVGRAISQQVPTTYNIRVTVPKAEDIEPAVGRATALMRAIRKDQPGHAESFSIERSQALTDTVNEIGDTLRAGGLVIGFITLLGAAVGLMNIMIVSVTERTREIGIRKSLGATSAIIRLQFLVEAILICLMGAAGGIVLGLSIGNLVAGFTGNTQFTVPVAWVMLGVVAAFIVGVISGYYPANRAAGVDPIESLKYE